MFNFTLYAQSVVRGKVTDVSSGNPVAGATVSVKNSTTATSTNNDGEFSINATNKDVLVVSFVGY